MKFEIRERSADETNSNYLEYEKYGNKSIYSAFYIKLLGCAGFTDYFSPGICICS